MVSAAPRNLRRAVAVATTVLVSFTGLAATAQVQAVDEPSLLTTATNQQLMAYYVNNYRTTRGIPALSVRSLPRQGPICGPEHSRREGDRRG